MKKIVDIIPSNAIAIRSIDLDDVEAGKIVIAYRCRTHTISQFGVAVFKRLSQNSYGFVRMDSFKGNTISYRNTSRRESIRLAVKARGCSYFESYEEMVRNILSLNF